MKMNVYDCTYTEDTTDIDYMYGGCREQRIHVDVLLFKLLNIDMNTYIRI